MKQQLMMSLVASLALGATAVSVQADPGSNNGKKAAAMQIKIDKKTGRKITPDDMEVVTRAANIQVPKYLDASGTIPLESIKLGSHPDGTHSALVGAEHHQYLTMTIDENGNRVVEHKSRAAVDAGKFEQTTSDEGVR